MHQPLAYVHPEAKIADNVVINPFVNISGDVEIGEGTVIGSNVTLFPGTRIGKNCKVFPGAVIGAIPQDLKFNGEYSTVEIGNDTIIRECVTINRGTKSAEKTTVGNGCLLMAYVHVAHDCLIGDHVILANNVNLAGHIEIGDYAILEGLVAVHQFVKIGTHSFVAGGSLVRKDIPHYIKAAREPLSYVGVNSIGLRRRGFTSEDINHILDIYRILFVRGYRMSKGIDIVEAEIDASVHRDHILTFVRNSVRGVLRGFQHRNGNGRTNGH